MIRKIAVLSVALVSLLACGRGDNGARGADSSRATAAAHPAVGSAGYAFVSNEASDDVSVIDLAGDSVIATIPVGKRPRGIHVSPDGATLYVAVSGSPRAGPGVDESKLPPADRSADGIVVVDVASRKVVKRLPGGTDPETFALSPDGKTIYVSNEDAAKASVIDIAKGSIVATIPVGTEPEGVAFSPDGKTVIVTSEGKGQISIIDAPSAKVVATLDVGKRPRNAIFTRDGTHAIVTAEVGSSLSLVDVAARRVTRTIPIVAEGAKPMGIVLSPDEKLAYVTTGRRGELAMIDLDSAKIVASAHVGDRPWGVAITPDGKTLYTANGPSNTVAVVSAPERRVVRTIAVGKLPWGIALSPR